MKKVFLIGFLLSVLINFVHSQIDDVHARESFFLKRIENNKTNGRYNLAGKIDSEKRFFGDFNARVEFFFEPGGYNHDFVGFRTIKKGSSYILEVKYISNFNEIEKKFEDKIKSALASGADAEALKIMEEKNKLYKIGSRSIPISNFFADKLYETMFLFISNFKATEMESPDLVPVTRGFGGSATFRTVVKAEVWSLYITWIQDDVRKMSDLCREIITDVRTNKFGESKYIYALDTIEYR